MQAIQEIQCTLGQKHSSTSLNNLIYSEEFEFDYYLNCYFNELVEQWYAEIKLLSFVQDMVETDAANKLVSLGFRIVPLIINHTRYRSA